MSVWRPVEGCAPLPSLSYPSVGGPETRGRSSEMSARAKDRRLARGARKIGHH